MTGAEPKQLNLGVAMVALLGGADGLDHYRKLATDCLTIIKPGGLLLLEHGIDQQTAIIEILSEHGWEAVEGHNDYSGNPRAVSARAPAGQA